MLFFFLYSQENLSVFAFTKPRGHCTEPSWDTFSFFLNAAFDGLQYILILILTNVVILQVWVWLCCSLIDVPVSMFLTWLCHSVFLLVITTVKHPKLVSFFVLFPSPISLHILSFNQLGIAYDLIFPYASGYNYLCFLRVQDLFVHGT